jgi:hypothetical protein
MRTVVPARAADGADLDLAGPVEGRHRHVLGESVALEHGDTDAVEEVAEALAEGGAAAHRVPQPPPRA